LILSDRAIQACFFSTGRLIPPSSAFGAFGIGGINFDGQLASRAILTKSGPYVAECANLTGDAFVFMNMENHVIGIVRNERVGRAFFAFEII